MGISKTQLIQLRKMIKRRDHPRRAFQSAAAKYKITRPKYFVPPNIPAEPHVLDISEIGRVTDLMGELGLSFKAAKELFLYRKYKKR